jgi:hypothetical protein
MEFRLPHINPAEPAKIQIKIVTSDRDFDPAITKIYIEIEHDGISYNSVYDEIVFIGGQRKHVISCDELKFHCYLHFDLTYDLNRYYKIPISGYNEDYNLCILNRYAPIRSYLRHLYIKKPTSDKINIVEIKNVTTELVINSMEELEKCPICADKVATINLSRSSYKYCNNCDRIKSILVHNVENQ